MIPRALRLLLPSAPAQATVEQQPSGVPNTDDGPAGEVPCLASPADVLARTAPASVLAAELAARAAFEAHDPEAWSLVAVAQRRRRIILAGDAADREDADGTPSTGSTSPAKPSEHERLTAGTADLWRQFAVMARGTTP